VSRAISWLTYSLLCGFLDFDRLKIVGENAFAAGLVVGGKDSIRIDPTVAPLPVLTSLVPVELPQAIAFESVSSARLSYAAGKAGFDDRDRVGFLHQR
jgi:hypothetical protein